MSSPSTLSPRDVAIAMVDQGVTKHRTRYDKVFFKVCTLLLKHNTTPSYLSVCIPQYQGSRSRCTLVNGRITLRDHRRWFSFTEYRKPGNCEDSWRFCLPCRARNVQNSGNDSEDSPLLTDAVKQDCTHWSRAPDQQHDGMHLFQLFLDD